jgi:hypothetical protein
MTAGIAGVVAAIATGALVLAAPAVAHHAIGGTVDTGRQLEHSMTLTKIDWINPHAWFHFTLRQANGTVQRDVRIEWMSLSGMTRAGLTQEDFGVGDTYQVTYYPNRDGSPGGHLVRMIDRNGEVIQRR